MSISSWIPSLGRLVISIADGRIMYAGLASGYSFSFQVTNGAVDTRNQAPSPLQAGASGAVINSMLPVASPAGDLFPQAVRLWDKLAVSQRRGSAVNASAVIQLSLLPRAALPTGTVISITGILGAAADDAAVARGQAASPALAALLALEYAPEHAAAAALGAYATWVPGIVPPPPPPPPGTGFLAVSSTLFPPLTRSRSLWSARLQNACMLLRLLHAALGGRARCREGGTIDENRKIHVRHVCQHRLRWSCLQDQPPSY